MSRWRFAFLGAALALALGTASAFAMQGATDPDPDAHGDTVASAAHTCPHGANGVHGACVSAIASAQGQASQEAGQSARVKACKAQRVKGDKASQRAFAACVSGDTTAPKGS